MKRLFSLLLLFAVFASHAGVCTTTTVCAPGQARPAGSTGAGFFVAGARLYDPTGIEFRIRGPNRSHPDQVGANTGIPLTGANAVRLLIDFTKPATTIQAVVDPFVAAGLVPIPANWGGTCNADPAKLSAIVDTWVAQAPTWAKYANTSLINIANEWGPTKVSAAVVNGKTVNVPNTVWLDGYTLAIQRLRAAGYLQTLVVDAGYCGQDVQSVVQDGAALLAADPQHNVLFSVHVYSSFHYPATASWQQDYAKSMAALKATGLPILIGEFGPAPFTTADGVVHKVGPSATEVPTATLVADAESNGFGWMPWAWDDNNLSGCATSYQGWFGMTLKCGIYTGQASELTQFGQTVVPLFRATGAKLANLPAH